MVQSSFHLKPTSTPYHTVPGIYPRRTGMRRVLHLDLVPGPAPYLATLTVFSFGRTFHLDVVVIWTYFSFVRSFHLDVVFICTYFSFGRTFHLYVVSNEKLSHLDVHPKAFYCQIIPADTQNRLLEFWH